jgi:lysozyme family protein
VIELPERKVERLIDQAVTDAMGLEGVDSNDPDDAGGRTRFGVTEAFARSVGYTGHMDDLTLDKVRALYRQYFVVMPGFDKVLQIDPSIGAELVECGINLGPGAPSTFLQRWLNGFNVAGARYAPLKVDGRIGAVTLEALKAFLRWRGPMGATALLRGLNCSQGQHYLERSEIKPTNRKFLFGWITNRVAAP